MVSRSRALYSFHRELNRPFSGTEDLAAYALERISRHIRADRISCFLLRRRDGVLALQLSLWKGLRQELEEEIHVIEGTALDGLLRGKLPALRYRSPHPIAYVPLTLTEGLDALGVLRLERYPPPLGRGSGPFTMAESRAAADFAAELAQNLRQAEAARRGGEQLRRLEVLTELTAIFASSLRMEDGLKLILQGIVRHFALDRARLYLVDRGSRRLRGELAADMRGVIQSLRSEEYAMEPGTHRFVDMLLEGREDPSLRSGRPSPAASECARAMTRGNAASRIRWEAARLQDPLGGGRQTVLHIPLKLQAVSVGLLVLDNLISQQPIQEEEEGLLRSFAGQIALAVDNARLFDEVQALSLYDGLTGLPVRRYFEQRFQEELYRAQRSGQPFALALMDIDYFKGINDTYGHQIGDQVLQAVGKAILAKLRKIDFPCRYGGDEILLLLPQAGSEEAARTLERLSSELKGVAVPVPFSKAREVRVTFSVGVASYPEDASSLEGLLQRADEALYWVKSGGRDGVAAYARMLEARRAGGPESAKPA